MQRKNVWFPEPLVCRAERVAEEMGIRLPDVVRKALEEYVERQESKKQQ